MESLTDVGAVLQRLVSGLDASVLDPAEAERLVGEFTTIERVAAAGRAACAGRVAGSGRWRSSGAKSDADWLARTTGESVGAARSMLETAERVAGLPATLEAVRAGRLSGPQAAAISAAAISAAAAVAPDTERLLLASAPKMPLGKLRDACNRIRAAGSDIEERHRRIHASRFWRTWTDGEGARCGQYRLTPEAGAVLEAAASPYVEAAYRAARDEKRHEPSDAYAADGLVAMAQAVRDGNLKPPAGSRWPKGETILLVDHSALRRGELVDGETCEIAGIGPVPVSVATELFGESLLKIVIRDGVDIRTVVHPHRRPTAMMLTALLARDGWRCNRPSCDRPIAQIDHQPDWAQTHHTTLDQLAGYCDSDHTNKTVHGHTYTHQPGNWQWHHPNGHTEESPPGRDPPGG